MMVWALSQKGRTGVTKFKGKGKTVEAWQTPQPVSKRGLRERLKHLARAEPQRSQIAVIDGRACAAEWNINGEPVFSEKEKINVERRLILRGVEVNAQKLPSVNIAKTAGLKYKSRSEALAHLEHGEEPESGIIGRLQKEISELKQRVDQHERREGLK